MIKLLRLSCLCAFSLGLLAFSGCNTVSTVTSGSAKGYTTASFVTEARPGFTPEETQADLMIREAIKNDFESHGIKGVPPGEGQLIVNYLIIVQDKASTTAIADYYGSSTADIISAAHGKRGSVGELPRGAVVIDVIDAATSKVIYRNYTAKTLTPNATEATRRSRINEAVKAALADFFN